MTRFLLIFFLILSPLFAYENLSPAQVHARLAAGDSVQLLDVREVSEYRAGHIAEPAGRLISIPANMPWSSGVLSQNYHLLPTDIDIIVNCQSGARSASAAAFLESKGFSRIFNMTSGFNGWKYEARSGGYGDGSGAWVGSVEMTIPCSQAPTTAFLVTSQNVFQDKSVYVELHKIETTVSPFENLPDSSQLFLTIAVDEFGLSIFKMDTLGLENFAEYRFATQSTRAFSQFYSPNFGWIETDARVANGNLAITAKKLYKWLLVVPDMQDGVAEKKSLRSFSLVKVYPNPFNGSLNITTPAGAMISIYDSCGRFVATLNGSTWSPASFVGSGLYFLQVRWQDKIAWHKVIYSK